MKFFHPPPPPPQNQSITFEFGLSDLILASLAFSRKNNGNEEEEEEGIKTREREIGLTPLPRF